MLSLKDVDQRNESSLRPPYFYILTVCSSVLQHKRHTGVGGSDDLTPGWNARRSWQDDLRDGDVLWKEQISPQFYWPFLSQWCQNVRAVHERTALWHTSETNPGFQVHFDKRKRLMLIECLSFSVQTLTQEGRFHMYPPRGEGGGASLLTLESSRQVPTSCVCDITTGSELILVRYASYKGEM